MIKTLIVDDEPLAVEILETYVNQIPQLELIGKCYNALDANRILNQQTIDLLLVDVQMPQMNGIELIKSLLHPPKFIFTTAYPEFAVEGFELNAVDYLLKPIDFNRFLKAINKIPQLNNPEEKPDSKPYDKQDFIFTLQTMKSLEEKLPDHSFIRVHRSYIVNIHKIDAIHSNDVDIYVKGQVKEIPIGSNYSDNVNRMINLKKI